ncbi:hypothetical protein N8D56_04970 [Devosia sp. A8/3-2]|nr:hypothetical protein N8D56_04970 [Devosia sp. A8/3-2]
MATKQDPQELRTAFLEAERLRNEPAFQAAMIQLRKEALEELVAADPTNPDDIREAQATVRAIDGLATKIGNAILRWQALTPAQRAEASA